MECYLLACKSDPDFTQSLLHETCAFCSTSAITVVKANIHRALQSQSPAGFTCFFAIARIFKENVCVACLFHVKRSLCPVRHDLSLFASQGECAAREPLAAYNWLARRGLRPPLCPTELILQKSSRVKCVQDPLATAFVQQCKINCNYKKFIL